MIDDGEVHQSGEEGKSDPHTSYGRMSEPTVEKWPRLIRFAIIAGITAALWLIMWVILSSSNQSFAGI